MKDPRSKNVLGDIDLIMRAKTDNEALSYIIENSGRFVSSIISKYIHFSPDDRSELDDYYQIGMIGLIKAIRAFDPDRGYKLSTPASVYIQNAINMYKRKEKRWNRDRTYYLDEPILGLGELDGLRRVDTLESIGPTVEEIVIDGVGEESTFGVEDVLAKLYDGLDPTLLQTLELLMKGLSQEEVASVVGVTQASVSRYKSRLKGLVRLIIESNTVNKTRKGAM